MRDLQRQKLVSRAQGLDLQWHSQLEEIKAGEAPPAQAVLLTLSLTKQCALATEKDKDTFTVVLAHEFFDALPINVFEVRLGQIGRHLPTLSWH